MTYYLYIIKKTSYKKNYQAFPPLVGRGVLILGVCKKKLFFFFLPYWAKGEAGEVGGGEGPLGGNRVRVPSLLC